MKRPKRRHLETVECRIIVADRSEFDLTRQADVEAWMEANRPQVVVVTAAKVGGIFANNEYPPNRRLRRHNVEVALRVVIRMRSATRLVKLACRRT